MKNQSHVLLKSLDNFLITSLFFAASILFLILSPPTAYSAQVVLAWNSVAESDGYKLYHGSASRVYHEPEDVGNQTGHTLDLDPGTHFFSVTAYNVYGESAYSDEVSCTIQDNVPVTYVVVASAGENGAISPSGEVTVSQGSCKTFSITPNQGCHVKDVLVDGVSAGAVTNYTFSNVTEDHTISAGFEIDSHVITASAGDHGTISPSGGISVPHGSGQTFTITPDQDYDVAEIVVDAVSMGPETSYTFQDVTSSHTITANFAIKTHVIMASAGGHGSIEPAGSVSVNHGEDQSHTIIPDENYHVVDVVVDGISVGAVTSHTFSDITEDHAIFAGFGKNNQAPVASAGPDQSVDEGATVTLNGSNSSDPDPNDVIDSYLWEQTGGQPAYLSAPNDAITTFSAPDVDADGDALVFRLTVTDKGDLKSMDECIVNVSSINVRPTANAGSNQEANEGDTVTLDGTGSSDPDGDNITYLWEQIAGPQVKISTPVAAQATFPAPDVETEGVSLTFQLTVEDNGGLKSTDTCIVNVLWVNIPPVADAGPDQTAVEGGTLTLDGSGSTDEDDNITSYRWRQIDGIPVTLSDPTAVKPTFEIPQEEQDGSSSTFQLTVKDTGGLEDTDMCSVDITLPTTHPPIPDIKANGQDDAVTVSYGTPVQITVDLDPGDYAGQRADWWISVHTPDDSWHSYVWRKYKWVTRIRRSYGGQIKDSFREVLDTQNLSRGTYTFYFAVDDNRDRKPDSTWLDAVEVYVE